MTSISAIVLAGGRGTRMQGIDKGLVNYQGRPMIEHVVERISTQVDDIIISANRNLQRYGAYADRVVSDEVTGFNGPLSGIASCLPYCKHPRVLVVACDMPRLPQDLVQLLQQAMAQHPVSIITCEQRPQLAMLISVKLLPTLNAALAHGDFKLMDWVTAQPHSCYEYPDPAAFTNLNSPHDLKA